MKPDALLFDLDGTLLDSETIIIESWKIAHNKVCPEITWNKDQLLTLMGQPAINIPFGMGVPEDKHKEYIEVFSLMRMGTWGEKRRIF